MKRFSAQYIITATGDILKRGIITTDNEGVIIDVADTSGDLKELAFTTFFNGIIIPGMVNCHCHLELSAMKGVVEKNLGLGKFIRNIRERREDIVGQKIESVKSADSEMVINGIVACADICNTNLSFETKEKSTIRYINLLEIFGIDPEKAQKRIDEIIKLQTEASCWSAPNFIVPHSVYSLSGLLLKKLKPLTSKNSVTSIHFMESEQEKEFISGLPGEMMESYSALGITTEMLYDRAPGHPETINSLITQSGNLILVHNTFAIRDDILKVMKRANTFWCLCPNSNLYIEGRLPPVNFLKESNLNIVLGTDSLASNSRLSILEEMKTLRKEFPETTLEEIVRWGTINGAMALGMENEIGTIEPGKKPGLVLLENCDLENFEFTETTKARVVI